MNEWMSYIQCLDVTTYLTQYSYFIVMYLKVLSYLSNDNQQSTLYMFILQIEFFSNEKR